MVLPPTGMHMQHFVAELVSLCGRACPLSFDARTSHKRCGRRESARLRKALQTFEEEDGKATSKLLSAQDRVKELDQGASVLEKKLVRAPTCL